MNVKKEAAKDALEYSRAVMAIGEGAGTRRKLIKATVDHKANTIPGYLAAFNNARLDHDMAQMAAAAKRDRVVKDTTKAVGKNVKGLATGNYRSVSAPILVVVGVGYVLHTTGYDKKIVDYTKKKWTAFKSRRKMQAEVRSILAEHE